MRHNKEITGKEPQMPGFQAANSDKMWPFTGLFMAVMSVVASFDCYIITNWKNHHPGHLFQQDLLPAYTKRLMMRARNIFSSHQKPKT